jgi:hypothetical protein
MAEKSADPINLPNQLAYWVLGVARALDCSEHAARRVSERGLIPARRHSRRLIVLADELEAFRNTAPHAHRRGDW